MLKKSLMALALVGAAASVQAATVNCGDATLGDREVTVTGAEAGGYCYAQNGNFNGDNLSMIPGAEELLLKNNEWGSDFVGGATSGSWSIASSLWSTYDKLYLAFHFGGGGDKEASNPDSFIVELQNGATSGTWAGNWGQRWGLSNLYLAGACSEGSTQSGCGTTEVPVPGTLGLLGLGLVGLGAVRRKQKA